MHFLRGHVWSGDVGAIINYVRRPTRPRFTQLHLDGKFSAHAILLRAPQVVRKILLFSTLRGA